jgi:hypothetical protein
MRRFRRTVAASAASCLVAMVAAGLALATFKDTSSNPGNSFSAGTLDLTDDDNGSVAFNLTGLKPTTPAESRCIQVSYAGNGSGLVRLYGSTTGSLASHLNLKVERGAQASPSFPSCTGFAPDSTSYIGAGAGVVYDGTLSAYPTSYAAGVVDAPGAAETWTGGEAHSYRLTVSLADEAAAQGLSSTAAGPWEARQQ